MSEKDTGLPNTLVGEFLARRGCLIRKEYRDFLKLKCDYGTTLGITTLILSINQGNTVDHTYGVKMLHENPEAYDESCFLDFDELKELLLAIKHIFQTAQDVFGTDMEYTEFEYSTKDSMKVGFYQSSPTVQQAFFDVSPGGSMMFITLDDMREIFAGLKSAREYLVSRGAGSDSVSTNKIETGGMPQGPRT